MLPEISVIMSVYNGESYLSEAIDSVISQTFKAWELIIINDCSQDKTADILAEYEKKDNRIKVFTNEVNLKLPTSLNKAISESRGKYIARMDSDDICLADRLEKQYKFMEANQDVTLSSCRFLTLKNGVYSSGGCGGRCDSAAISAMLLVTNPILHPGVIMRADALKNINYNTSLTCTEDLELWTKMAMKGLKMQILPEYLLIYRLHDKQITSTTLERQHSEVLKIQEKFYAKTVGHMADCFKEFYISGVYFKENMDIDKFLAFKKWIKNENKKSCYADSEALDYALFEILAEYKRVGMCKKDILKGILSFNWFFLLKETSRRKKSAKKDGTACIKSAETAGLARTAGTDVFPIFEIGE